MKKDYFLHVKGQQEGPFTLKELQERYRTRRGINGETLFWQEGMDEWFPLSHISDMLQTQSYNPHVAAARASAPRESDKRILPAFLLFLPLGSLGVHRFYVGRIAGGFVYIVALILVLVGIANPHIRGLGRCGELFLVVGFLLGGIVGLVDYIQIVTGDFRDGDGNRITRWT